MMTVELSDDEVLRMLRRAFLDTRASFIMLDGHELRNSRIRTATRIAVDRGWLHLGELVEEDQWSWYEATITEAGREALGKLEEKSTDG